MPEQPNQSQHLNLALRSKR